MDDRESRGRQLVVELDEYLRTGGYPREAHDLLGGIVHFMRKQDLTTPVDGVGEIICDPRLFISITPTADGIGLAPPEAYEGILPQKKM